MRGNKGRERVKRGKRGRHTHTLSLALSLSISLSLSLSVFLTLEHSLFSLLSTSSMVAESLMAVLQMLPTSGLFLAPSDGYALWG